MFASAAENGAPFTRDIAALIDGATSRWVLDPLASRAEFHIKHFWGIITVHGRFERISGEGVGGPNGVVSGRLLIDASSLNSNNRQRDKHLRSADFFDVERHPEVVVTVRETEPLSRPALLCRGTLEAAGHEEPIEFTASVQEIVADAVTLHAEVILDRTKFGMTWNPLRMAARQVRAVSTARFVRQ